MSFLKHFKKKDSKEVRKEIDYSVINREPSKFVVKVYSDLGAGQLVQFLGSNKDITVWDCFY